VEQNIPTLLASRFQTPARESNEIIRRAIIGMIDELETNMYEDQTYQRLVDFGHTISPALEAASQFKLPHGQAVAISMAFCCELAKQKGLMTNEDCERTLETISRSGLPTSSSLLTKDVVRHALSEATRHRAGKLNLVLPTRIGSGTFVESADLICEQELRGSIECLANSATHDQERGGVLGEQSSISLVFDIGGTNLRAAIYDPQTNQLVKRGSKPTPNHHRHPDLPPDDILRLLVGRMDDLAEELLDGQVPANVTVAFAGPLNKANQITAAPTIWGTTAAKPFNLLADLEVLWPAPQIHLFNDVTAAGYRYLRAADESLCMITVGSGIGNKIFIDGQPFTGNAGRGGEIGHIVVDHDPDAIVCDCGQRGHLGGIASGRGTLATAKRWAERDPNGFARSSLFEATHGQADQLTNSEIVNAFHEGDVWAGNVISYVAGKLANVMAHIHQALGIERFVIFGGFGTALGEKYRDLLVASAQSDCWSSGQDWDQMIELGAADDDSGLLGAGRFANEFRKAK